MTSLLVLAVLLGGIWVTAPRPSAHFTEFYLLGAPSLADGYPLAMVAERPETLTIGVTNYEGQAGHYTVTIIAGQRVIGISPILALGDRSNWEQPFQIAIPSVGDHQRIDIVLDRAGYSSPYRQLHIWVNVRKP